MTVTNATRRALAWLVAPAVDTGQRSHAVAATALRITAGFLWLYNVSWKNAPDFGRDRGVGLYLYTNDAVKHPVLPPYSWLVEHLVLPHFTLFAVGVLVAESALAVLLLSGAFVRLAAALGVAQSTAIGLSVAFTPNEWPWSYTMMVGLHLVLLFSAAGRYLSVDSIRAGLSDGRRLTTTFGIAGVLVGLVGVVGSLGDPLAAGGVTLRWSDAEIGVGRYNLVGGLVLLAVGALLLPGTRSRVTQAPRIAALVGVLAALSLHAQLGFTDPILGGDPTSAAVYLTLAVLAAAVTLRPRLRTDHEEAAARVGEGQSGR